MTYPYRILDFSSLPLGISTSPGASPKAPEASKRKAIFTKAAVESLAPRVVVRNAASGPMVEDTGLFGDFFVGKKRWGHVWGFFWGKFWGYRKILRNNLGNMMDIWGNIMGFLMDFH